MDKNEIVTREFDKVKEICDVLHKDRDGNKELHLEDVLIDKLIKRDKNSKNEIYVKRQAGLLERSIIIKNSLIKQLSSPWWLRMIKKCLRLNK